MFLYLNEIFIKLTILYLVTTPTRADLTEALGSMILYSLKPPNFGGPKNYKTYLIFK